MPSALARCPDCRPSVSARSRSKYKIWKSLPPSRPSFLVSTLAKHHLVRPVPASFSKNHFGQFDRSSRAAIPQPPKRSPTYLTRKNPPPCHCYSCPAPNSISPFHFPLGISSLALCSLALLLLGPLANPRPASTTPTPEPVAVPREVQRTHSSPSKDHLLP